MSQLAVTDIYAGYKGTDVLRGVSLTVAPSECVALLGPNGAGKSTLLRVLTGQLRVRSGKRLIDNEDASRWRAHKISRAGVRWVGEPRPIFPSLTVGENLAIGGITDRMMIASRSAHVFELLPMLGERKNLRASSLSGGQQQMLAIGLSLMSEPRFLCLDEPSIGLAPQVVGAMADLIVNLASTGVGVLWAEQFPEVALRCSTKVVVLSAGSIAYLGHPTDISREQLEEAYLGKIISDENGTSHQ